MLWLYELVQVFVSWVSCSFPLQGLCLLNESYSAWLSLFRSIMSPCDRVLYKYITYSGIDICLHSPADTLMILLGGSILSFTQVTFAVYHQGGIFDMDKIAVMAITECYVDSHCWVIRKETDMAVWRRVILRQLREQHC